MTVLQAKFIAAGIGLMLLSSAPVSAQMSNSAMSMPKGQMGGSAMGPGHMAMSKAEMATMKQCHNMSHKAMMKSKRCTAMMKSHPDMMHSGKMGH
jgi:hypothetical protein